MDELEMLECRNDDCRNVQIGHDRDPKDDGWFLIGFGVWFCPNCKPDAEPINSEIRSFVYTPIGQEFFKSITSDMTRQARLEFKKSFLDPPSNVLRWLRTKGLLLFKMDWEKKNKRKVA